MNLFKTRLTMLALCAVAAFAGGVAQAADAALPAPKPIENYWAMPQYRGGTLSPNGQYLALLTPINNKYNLVVIDLKARTRTVATRLTDFDVLTYNWVGNDRISFSLGRLDTPTGPESGDGGGLFVVDRDGRNLLTVTKTFREMAASGAMVGRGLRFMRAIPDTDEFLANGNLRDAGSQDVYRVNSRTGRKTLLTFEHPGRVGDWDLDHNLVPRVAVVAPMKDEKLLDDDYRVMYRADEKSPWVEVERFSPTGDKFAVLGFSEDNRRFYVATNRGRDTSAIYLFDPDTKKLSDPVAAHPRFDMGVDDQDAPVPGVLLNPKNGKIIAFQVDAGTMETYYQDDEYAAVHAALSKTFPGQDLSIQRRPGGTTLVVASASWSPPQYFLFDEQKRSLEPLFTATDKLTSDDLVEARPFLLKTRDGLEIPSYYFLPKNYQKGQRLPTIIHVHGGPFARADRGGYMGGFGAREAQLYTSRGYAVIVPNFRITPGFGKKIFRDGFGKVGRQMSEDHEDAAKWAIDQGIAAPGRICITGASYGGYATLRALSKTPDLFACGVAGLSVTDYRTQLTSVAGDTSGNSAGVKYWRRALGLKEGSWEGADEVSPVFHADRFQSPVAMYAGRDDVRTPLEQTMSMARALEKAGRPAEFVLVKDGEAHGFGKLENNVDLYTHMLAFFDRHIGPKSPAARARVTSSDLKPVEETKAP